MSMFINQKHLWILPVFSHSLSVLCVFFRLSGKALPGRWYPPHNHMHEKCNKMHYNENCFLPCLFHLASQSFQSKCDHKFAKSTFNTLRLNVGKEKKTWQIHEHNECEWRMKEGQTQKIQRTSKRNNEYVPEIKTNRAWDNRIYGLN